MRSPESIMKRVLHRRSLVGAKVATRIAYLLLVICLAIFIYFPARMRDAALDGLGYEARAIANVTAQTLAAPIIFDDTAAVQETIRGLLAHPSVVWVSVEDAAAQPIASGQRPAAGDSPAAHTTRAIGLAEGGALYYATAPVTNDRETVGSLRIALTTARVIRETTYQRVHILTFSLLIFVTALVAVGILTTRLLSPLTQVASAAQAIARGDNKRRASVQTGDEIESLADSFNRMVDQLIQAQTELEQNNGELEERVRQRTQQLRASEERFRSMFERAPIGIALLDAGGHIFQANRPLEELLGYTTAELRALNVCELVECVDDDLKDITEVLRTRDINAEAICRGRDRLINARIAVSAVFGNTGEIQFISLMIVDLTAEKELEHKFRQSQKLEAVGRLAGGIAHDFNNLLTTITGLSELVAQELATNDPRRQDVEEIKKAGDRAALLTRQLLAFSRQQVLQARVLDLNAVIADVGTMLKRLIGEHIELRVVADASVQPVKADQGQLVQVLLNLAVNARDAMPNGGVLEIATGMRNISEAQARGLEMRSAGEHVALTVRDTGHGIDPAIIAHVFEPFFTTKEVGKGTGLGLATVYGIVKQSGGSITVESEPGRGTTFTILLPSHSGATENSLAPQLRSTGGHETILIAEDEPNVRSFVARVLRRAGYRVIESVDGTDALRAARQEGGPIHLLITDAVMPQMSGAELIVNLRNERPEVVPLVMSGYTRDTMKEQGMDLGEIAFLQKPISPAALTSAVRSVLDRIPKERPGPIAA